MAKKRKAVKTGQIKHLYAPQYNSLSVDKILAFAWQFNEIHAYFPEKRDISMLPRQVSFCPQLLLSH